MSNLKLSWGYLLGLAVLAALSSLLPLFAEKKEQNQCDAFRINLNLTKVLSFLE